MNLLNSLLSILPGNGSKRIIGIVAILLAQAFPDFGHWELVKMVLEYFGLGYGSIGVVHAIVKEKVKR